MPSAPAPSLDPSRGGSRMRILAYEHFTATSGPATASLRAEGGAMLRALVTDLVRAGHEVTTVTATDTPRLVRSALRRAGARLQTAHAAGEPRGFGRLLREVEAAWIVAPETGGCLESLARAARAAGVRLLGSSPEGIASAASKLRTFEALRAAGVRAVPTRVIEISGGVPPLPDGGGWWPPLVAKPDDGVGGERMVLVGRRNDLARAAIVAGGSGRAVLQPWIEGAPASVSVLVGPRTALPLAVQSQRIELAPAFRYAGGDVPLDSPFAEDALELAAAACRAIPGLAGYVGVDLVLTPNGPLVVEVNPRLTTSYLGLRRVFRENVAELALRVLDGESPQPPRAVRRVRFDPTGRVVVSGSRAGAARIPRS
ncbi:MAG: ATP-grasp domain-containing protein [Gemmatimonadota bacterium]